MTLLHLNQPYQDDRLVLDEPALLHTVEVALSFFEPSAYELSVVCVDKEESQRLNHQYRGKDKPTNVLSFVSELPQAILDELKYIPLGDLVICIPVVIEEASLQKKTFSDHFSHLLVHGLLHLLGYDHEQSQADADEMEALEIEILARLGIDNPYKDDEY